jgi:hypothetical protein
MVEGKYAGKCISVGIRPSGCGQPSLHRLGNNAFNTLFLCGQALRTSAKTKKKPAGLSAAG